MTTPTSEPNSPASEVSSTTAPPPASTSEMLTEPKPHELKDVPWAQVLMSTVGLACWILLYAAGLLMESVEERIYLAPHTMEKQLGPAYKDLVADVIEKVKVVERHAPPVPTGDTRTTAVSGNDSGKLATGAVSETKQSEAKNATDPKVEKPSAPKAEAKKESLLATRQPVSRTTAFFYSVLVYTPTNMALLTLFAGLLGGCVSNIKYSMLTKEERKKLKPHEDAILSENPLSATMRGFVIYLCMVAGLYVVLDDPFKDSSPGQYARLAGSMSLVAFIVGFDPTRIKAWLRMADNKSGSDSGNTQTGSPAKT